MTSADPDPATDSDGAERSSSDRGILDGFGLTFMLKDTALWLTGLLVVLAVIKLRRLARLDATTALAVIRYVDNSLVLLTAVDALVTLVLSLALGAVIGRMTAPGHGKTRWQLTVRITALSLIGALILGLLVPVPWWAFIVVLGLSQAWVLMPLQESERDSGRSEQKERGTRLLMVAVVVALFLMSFFSRPVLPLEEISLTNGSNVVSYVLNDESDTLIVLREFDRKIIRIPARDVKKRDFCAPQGTPHSTLHFFTKVKRPYPLCPRD